MCRHRAANPCFNEEVRRKYRHRLGRAAVALHATNPQNNMSFIIADFRFKWTQSHQTIVGSHLAPVRIGDFQVSLRKGTEVSDEGSSVWNVTAFWLTQSNREHRRVWLLHIQGQAASLTAWPWKWRHNAPPKFRIQFTRRQGIVFQKTWIFISTVKRTSNLEPIKKNNYISGSETQPDLQNVATERYSNKLYKRNTWEKIILQFNQLFIRKMTGKETKLFKLISFPLFHVATVCRIVGLNQHSRLNFLFLPKRWCQPMILYVINIQKIIIWFLLFISFHSTGLLVHVYYIKIPHGPQPNLGYVGRPSYAVPTIVNVYNTYCRQRRL